MAAPRQSRLVFQVALTQEPRKLGLLIYQSKWKTLRWTLIWLRTLHTFSNAQLAVENLHYQMPIAPIWAVVNLKRREWPVPLVWPKRHTQGRNLASTAPPLHYSQLYSLWWQQSQISRSVFHYLNCPGFVLDPMSDF